MKHVHLVARPSALARPLHLDPLGPVLWRQLQRGFPSALAVTTMPDHVHICAQVTCPRQARLGLARALSAAARSNAGEEHGLRWSPSPRPEIIVSATKLRRVVRYVDLNPTRAGLVGDPLAWRWNTLRDVVGAVADRWVRPPRLADALRIRRRRAAEYHHRYVTADPSVTPRGIPFPEPFDPRIHPAPSHEAIARAAIVVSRAEHTALKRRGPVRTLFLALARSLRPHDTMATASFAGVDASTVRRAPKPSDAEWSAALLVLGNPETFAHDPPDSTR